MGVRQKPGELPDNQPHDVRKYPNNSQYDPDFMDLTDSSGTERFTPPANSADNVPGQTFPLLGGPAGLAPKQVIPRLNLHKPSSIQNMQVILPPSKASINHWVVFHLLKVLQS